MFVMISRKFKRSVDLKPNVLLDVIWHHLHLKVYYTFGFGNSLQTFKLCDYVSEYTLYRAVDTRLQYQVWQNTNMIRIYSARTVRCVHIDLCVS